MTDQNTAFIEQHRHFLNDWHQSQVYRNLSGEIRNGFMRVIGEEFQPGYYADLQCGDCVGRMLEHLWQLLNKAGI